MTRCLACGETTVTRLADFGPQPVCHHFQDGSVPEGTHPLILGLCETCALTQLINPIPPARLTPHFDWITYNEPEAHLDAMTDRLRALPGIGPESVIAGITYKEDSTLRRFRERGCPNTVRLDPTADLDITEPRAGIETVQERLVPARAERWRARHGSPDLVVIRHTLEHAHDTATFLDALRQWVRPGGYLVFEIPECARGFELLDYTTLWEDHTHYFVEPTFLGTLARHRLETVRFERFRAPYENCLVAVTRSSDQPPALPSAESLETERNRVRRFAASFDRRRTDLRDFLARQRERSPVAVFGAGHQSATFLSLFGLTDLVRFVIDDHPQKSGRAMPGSRVPIVSTATALASEIRLWLMSVSAESECRILERNRDFLARGGTAASIYPVLPGELVHPLAPPS